MTQVESPPGYDYGVYYRAFHNESPQHVRAMVDAQKEMLTRLLPTPHEGRALDVGCGMGFTVLAMRELGYSAVDGIDVDPSQIEASCRLGANGMLVSDSLDFLRGRVNTYRLITLLDVLEHVPVSQQLDVIRATHAALQPRGHLIVQVPNATFILASRWRYGDFTHHSSFTDHSLSFVLMNAGFHSVTLPPSQVINRPSIKGLLLSSKERTTFRTRLRRWFVRWFWEQVIRAELPFEDVRRLCFDPNLVAVAVKAGMPGGGA
ncbi:MAG TPA: class I SAM-dependent methyltransferase [Gemmata sp.]|jgi:SAM-dependent methyltransferase|nr:class I SAM-dependent methyltransferase [Gemmata sp.]